MYILVYTNFNYKLICKNVWTQTKQLIWNKKEISRLRYFVLFIFPFFKFSINQTYIIMQSCFSVSFLYCMIIGIIIIDL